MFIVIDRENNHLPVKSGFKTASAANNWCKKHLDTVTVHLWGCKPPRDFRYYVMMRLG